MSRSRIYNLEDYFLDNIENWSSEQAYFLGWAATDGSNNLAKNYFKIKLQEGDINILKYLKSIIKFTGPVNITKRTERTINLSSIKKYQNCRYIVLSSPYLCERLSKLEVKVHNSRNFSIPKDMNSDLLPAFLLAAYEGDGTLSYNITNKTLRVDFNLLGCDKFLNQVKDILKNFSIPTRIEKLEYSNGVKSLEATGVANALRFFIYVYKNCPFCLKRKFKKFLRIINYTKRLKYHHTRREILSLLPKAIEITKDICKRKCY